MAQKWIFKQSLTNFTFYQHSQPLYDVMRKEIENLEFVHGVKFESLKKQRYNKLVSLWRFLWRDLQSKSILDNATAGRHHGLSTIYIKHTFVHQIKIGRDVELQNTHFVVIKSLTDVIQVSRLIAQIGLGLELVDWYRDATSVPYGHWLIDFSPRTIDWLRYCTNTGSIHSKLFIPDQLTSPKLLAKNTQNLFTL